MYLASAERFARNARPDVLAKKAKRHPHGKKIGQQDVNAAVATAALLRLSVS